jgi:glycosyltransferase involved in cell wall biosynthesis
LPNPVAVPSIRAEPLRRERKLLFYPTRGIRRKNIGEAVLLAVILADCGVEVATSRAPDNEAWLAIHDRWEAFVREQGIGASLAVVDNPDFGGHTFEEWLASASAIVTTSVTEGFGLAFLEPFLLGKPLVGRDLPDITRDFRDFGLNFPGLYHRLLVPIDWIDLRRFEERIEALLTSQYATYARTMPPDATRRAVNAIRHEDSIDLGGLEESFQEVVIARCLTDPSARKQVKVTTTSGETFPAPDWILAAMDKPAGGERAILENHFSLDAYGRRLAKIYEMVTGRPDSADAGPIDEGKVLDAFLSPENFRCLKST